MLPFRNDTNAIGIMPMELSEQCIRHAPLCCSVISIDKQLETTWSVLKLKKLRVIR